LAQCIVRLCILEYTTVRTYSPAIQSDRLCILIGRCIHSVPYSPHEYNLTCTQEYTACRASCRGTPGHTGMCPVSRTCPQFRIHQRISEYIASQRVRKDLFHTLDDKCTVGVLSSLRVRRGVSHHTREFKRKGGAITGTGSSDYVKICFCFQRVSCESGHPARDFSRDPEARTLGFIHSGMDSTLNQVIVDSTLKHECDLWTVVWSDAGFPNR